MGTSPNVPSWDADLGRYSWTEPAASESAPEVAIEPAFVREAVEQKFDVVRTPHGVLTFADVYPKGTKDHATTDAPSPDEEAADPGDEWRVDGGVADDILIALPDGTPRMIRTMLTLLLGSMRRSRG